MTDIPKIYDVTMDEMRPVTQADLDELMESKRRLMKLRLMLLQCVALFPTIAVDLRMADDERSRRNREAYKQKTSA